MVLVICMTHVIHSFIHTHFYICSVIQSILIASLLHSHLLPLTHSLTLSPFHLDIFSIVSSFPQSPPGSCYMNCRGQVIHHRWGQDLDLELWPECSGISGVADTSLDFNPIVLEERKQNKTHHSSAVTQCWNNTTKGMREEKAITLNHYIVASPTCWWLLSTMSTTDFYYIKETTL